jgi:hypothetical protein
MMRCLPFGKRSDGKKAASAKGRLKKPQGLRQACRERHGAFEGKEANNDRKGIPPT